MSEYRPNLVDSPKANLAGNLKQEFGGLWTGVALHYEVVPGDASVQHGMRLCEAVARSFVQPLVLPAQKIACPGALRSLGLLEDDLALAQRMSEKAGVPLATVRKALAETPCLTAPVTAISLGADHDAPDVVVGHVQPEEAMSLLRRWQVCVGHLPVVVRAHKLDEICVSLGCLDSRQFGGIGSDTLVVGMPSVRAGQIVSR